MLAIIFVVTLFIFSFTWIIFDFQGSDEALKNTWTIVSSLFGGITTLVAAYLAFIFYNDWKHIQRFELSKDILTALIELKSHTDKNHKKAEHYLNIYKLKNDINISTNYIALNINKARNCQAEKEEYSFKLDELSILFFKKIDLYESIFGIELISKDDRAFNFNQYFSTINTMFTYAQQDKSEKEINFILQHAKSSKDAFTKKYYENLMNKLKYKSLT